MSHKGAERAHETPADYTPPRDIRAATGTRHTILVAALDLFAERGYDGTSMEEIGRAVKITGPAIYRHFPNKETLLIAVYEFAGEERFRAATASRGLPASLALEVLLRSYVQYTFDKPQWTKVWILQRATRFPEAFDIATGPNQRWFLRRWEDVVAELRPDLPPEFCRELVTAVWGMINGLVYHPSELSNDDCGDFMLDAARRVIFDTQLTESEAGPRGSATDG